MFTENLGVLLLWKEKMNIGEQRADFPIHGDSDFQDVYIYKYLDKMQCKKK